MSFRHLRSTHVGSRLAKAFHSALLGVVFVVVFGAIWHIYPTDVQAQNPTVTSEHVIFVSVDGLRSDAITNLGPSNLPSFFRLINEGASTLNARNDPDYTITLPNHTSMLTGRFVSGSEGHNWTKNTDPSLGETIHNNAGKYVSSVFDVFHDEGLKTGLFATKSKFEIFFTSWDENNGAPDLTGADYGRSKIDATGFEASSMDVVQAFIQASSSGSFNFSFLHLYDPDHVGHLSSWDPQIGSVYSAAVMDADNALKTLLAFVESSPWYQGKTTIVLTADHGGVELGHADALNPLNYTIPFVVWGQGAQSGTDLYALNPLSRQDPGLTHIPRSFPDAPPIRNADGANLSLRLLGLPAIPGSTINPLQDLLIGSPTIVNPVTRVAFQDGVAPTPEYEGTRDTKIVSTSPTTVFGSDPTLEMDAEADLGVLLSWDLMSIPQNATVTEASFVFDITDVSRLDYEYYVATRWWDEDVATWITANSSADWGIAGALGPLDHQPTSLGTITAATTGTYTFALGDNALAAVQEWVSNPGSNYGFIFQDYTSGDDGLDLSSREALDPTKRPRLELSYTLETVARDPLAPVPNFEMTLSREVTGVEFSADASTSSDSNGTIVTYEWDFGDGSTGTGIQATHTYASAGIYRVVLTVTDDSGEKSQLDRLVIVDQPGENVLAFQDGAQPAASYQGTQDTKILAASSTSNFGEVDNLEMDGSPNDVSLVRWDISGIPPGVTVTAATLVFDVLDPSTEAYGVFGLQRQWNENEATWERATDGVMWSMAGAGAAFDTGGSSDFGPIRLAKVGPAPVGTHSVALNAAGIELVSSWINDPYSNFGFVFRDDIGSQDGLDFASRETAFSSKRPRLEIAYFIGEVAVPPDTSSEISTPPLAGFDMTLVRDVGAISVSVDAAPSTAQSGELTYTWSFDSESGGTSRTASYAFQQVGAHTVTLLVTDEKGASHALTRTVMVDVHGENEAGFQDGVAPLAVYEGTRDTKILSGAKTANFGSDAVLEMDGSPQNESLIKWDLAGIAPGVDVLDVTLHFEVVDPAGEEYGVFGLLRPWEEQASTWMEAAKGFSWELDGANGENDFLPDVFADLGPAEAGPLSVSLNEAGREWVEQWINNPASNHGFILRDYSNSQDGLDLASREAALVTSRPRIDIRYQSQHHVELPQKLTIGAYPNPFTDQLTIDLASPISHEVRLELYDMLGRRVTDQTLAAGQVGGPIRLNTSTLMAGVYALRVTEHGSIVSTTKLVTKGY